MIRFAGTLISKPSPIPNYQVNLSPSSFIIFFLLGKEFILTNHITITDAPHVDSPKKIDFICFDVNIKTESNGLLHSSKPFIVKS